MSFAAGFAGSIADEIKARDARERAEADLGNERNSKIALHLLEAPDPDVQMAGLSMLQRAAAPIKRKKGLQGFLGGVEQPDDSLRPFLDVINQQGRPGQLESPPASGGGGITQPPGPGGAALPAGSPVEPGGPAVQQPAQPVQPAPGGSPLAAARGQAQPEFGGDQGGTAGGFQSPMAAAMGGQPAQPPAAAPPSLNVAVTAKRLSQDRGTLAPGQAQALFWPTSASLAANRVTSELGAKADFLRKLGASPEDVQQTMMATMGHPMGATSATRAGTVKLPSGEVVETYIQRDPASNTVGRMYWNGSAMAPLPAGAIEQKLGGAGAGPAVTTHMTAAQAVNDGIIEDDGTYQPGDYLKVVQKGDTLVVQRDVRPQAPFGFMGAPGSPNIIDRGGNAQPNPGYVGAHPKVAAAKALIAALSADVAVKAGVPAQNKFAQYAASYPALANLSIGQVQSLAQLGDNATDQDVQRILGAMAIQPPPGATAAPPAPGKPQATAQPAGDPNGLPADWATQLADEIRRGRPRQ